MKTPTHDLEEEHGGIILMLNIIEKMSDMIKGGNNISKDHLNKVIDFLKNFADKCHHGKEEGILFPELIKTPSNVSLVNELLGEHKTGRDYIRGMIESLEQFQAGNPDAYHIAINMVGYVRLLTDHIHKENVILFPLAEKQLSSDFQNQIEERFATFERDVIGTGKHEEYHEWLKELQTIYLKNKAV